MESKARADAIIADHVVYSMLAAAIPVPVADIAAVTAVQLDMVRGLAEHYSVKYEVERGKAIVLSLAGASAARLGASAVKMLPLAGTLIGGATQIVLSGASSYAVGEVFRRHFEADGSLSDLDPDDLRRRYREYVQKGREIARTLRERAMPFCEPERAGAEEVAETLERLERLRACGAISQEEFDRLKKPLLEESG